MTLLQKIKNLKWFNHLEPLKDVLLDLNNQTESLTEKVSDIEANPGSGGVSQDLQSILDNNNTANDINIQLYGDSEIRADSTEGSTTVSAGNIVTGSNDGKYISIGHSDIQVTNDGSTRFIFPVKPGTIQTLATLSDINPDIPEEYTDEYVLDEMSLTSAGVFNADGKLLRTLWSGVKKPEGTYSIDTIEWDGLDDDGEDVTSQAAYYKVASNNVSELWEGVIGNNSDTLIGENVWHSMAYPCDGLIIGNKMYIAYGSNEQTGPIGSFLLDDYQKQIQELYSPTVYPSYTHLAYDGTNLYFAGKWEWSAGGNNSGVSSSTLANLRNYNNWNNPTSQTVTIEGTAFPIMDKVDNPAKPRVTGLAVTPGDIILAVARGSINSLRIVNKGTGALIQEHTTFINPKLCKSNQYNQLFFIHGAKGSEVGELFAVNNSTGELISLLVIPGFNDVRAVEINHNSQFVFIAESDGSDRVKQYSLSSGSELVALCLDESYSVDATLKDMKFMLTRFDDPESLSFIALPPEGGLWVNDIGNYRIVKISGNNGAYEDAIQFLPLIHEMTIDRKDPTRVFSAFKEFKINYSAPLQLGNVNRAWQLVKNWGAIDVLAAENVFTEFDKLRYVETMPNGRTYGLVIDKLVDPKPASQRFIEFVEGGVIRDTGVTIFDSTYRTSMKKNGRIVRGDLIDSGSGYDWIIYEKLITGFDGSNNPIIGAEAIISRVLNANIPSGFPGDFGEKTANGNMIQIHTGKGSPGDFHISGSKVGGTDITFKTTRGVAYPVPDEYHLLENTYDIRDGVQYMGNEVIALDNWFMWGYRGEFWRGTQTNYWQMLTEDGLFLYAFGTDGTKGKTTWTSSPWGMAGNAIKFALVKVGGQVYLYHNDESFHGGIHRWKITNTDSIKEFKLLID